MPGTVYLHSVSHMEAGMFDQPCQSEQIPYVVPSSRLVQILQRRFYGQVGKRNTTRFFTFDRFVRWLLSLDKERLLTPVTQELLVQQAVSRVEEKEGFHYFSGVITRPGWLRQVAGTIGEMKRAGVRPGRLKRLWKHHGAKYEELARIYEAYQELLNKYGWVDHEEPYFQVCDSLLKQNGKVLLPKEVIMEQFFDLTFMQQEVLIQLVTAGVDVNVHLAWDENRPRLFQEIGRTIERLRQRGFYIQNVTPPKHGQAKKVFPLLHLEQAAFSPRPDSVKAEGAVEVIAAASVTKEVEETVARLKDWLRKSRAALTDVALVVSDQQTYAFPLLSALEKAGIPCEQGKTLSLRSHPLMQTLLGALALRQGKEHLRPALLESPYLPWAGERQVQSCWIREYHRLGEPRKEKDLLEGFQRLQGEPTLTEEEQEGLRSFYRWVERVPSKARWKEWIDWFHKWAEVLRQEGEWVSMAQDADLLSVLVGELDAWKQIYNILEEWKAIFHSTDVGEQTVPLAAFVAALEQAVHRKEVHLTQGERGGVHLLEPNQLGGNRYRAVFMLGCAEGQWPRPVREDWLIPDRERLRLRQEEIAFATSSELRAQKLAPFFHSARTATEFLVFSYTAMTQDGKGKLPSPYLDELLELFNDDSVVQRHFSPSDRLPERWEDCLSVSHAVEKAVDVLNRSSEEGSNVDQALQVIGKYRRVHTMEFRRLWEQIQSERIRWGKRYSSFDGVLDPSPLQQEVGRALQRRVWSATSLNDLVQCRFHFMAEQIWGVSLREGREKGLSSSERGRIFHRVLCRFWDRYRVHSFDPDQEENHREHLLYVIERVFAEVAEEGGWKQRDPLRMRIEKNRLQKQLLNMLEHEIAWRKKAKVKWTPRYLEWAFGMNIDPIEMHRGEMDPETRTSPTEVQLSADIRLRLRGRVDRVDMDDEGNYVIYDYKSGSAPRAKEIQAGDQLQLPLYLWALQKEMGLLPEKAAGAAYYTTGTNKGNGSPPTDNRNQGMWRKALAKKVGISSQGGGLLDEEAWDAVQEEIGQRIQSELQKARQGNFAVAPARECPPFCPHRSICRIDRLRMARKERLEEEGEESE